MKRMMLCFLLLSVVVSGCVSMHREASGFQLSEYEEQVVERKALKYGINPNLLHAVVITEFKNASFALEDREAQDWAIEQIARVLNHILIKTGKPRKALGMYASGTLKPDSDVYWAARPFVKEAFRTFCRLERANPWKQE